MPHPAFKKLKQTVTTVVQVGESAARRAAPVVRRTAGDLVARVRKQGAAPPAPAPRTGGSARPSDRPTEVTASDPAPAPEASTSTPSPASIAKNVPHQRPVAKPAPARKPRPTDSPGGKLPPRR